MLSRGGDYEYLRDSIKLALSNQERPLHVVMVFNKKPGDDIVWAKIKEEYKAKLQKEIFYRSIILHIASSWSDIHLPFNEIVKHSGKQQRECAPASIKVIPSAHRLIKMRFHQDGKAKGVNHSDLIDFFNDLFTYFDLRKTKIELFTELNRTENNLLLADMAREGAIEGLKCLTPKGHKEAGTKEIYQIENPIEPDDEVQFSVIAQNISMTCNPEGYIATCTLPPLSMDKLTTMKRFPYKTKPTALSVTAYMASAPRDGSNCTNFTPEALFKALSDEKLRKELTVFGYTSITMDSFGHKNAKVAPHSKNRGEVIFAEPVTKGVAALVIRRFSRVPQCEFLALTQASDLNVCSGDHSALETLFYRYSGVRLYTFLFHKRGFAEVINQIFIDSELEAFLPDYKEGLKPVFRFQEYLEPLAVQALIQIIRFTGIYKLYRMKIIKDVLKTAKMDHETIDRWVRACQRYEHFNNALNKAVQVEIKRQLKERTSHKEGSRPTALQELSHNTGAKSASAWGPPKTSKVPEASAWGPPLTKSSEEAPKAGCNIKQGII